VKAPVIITRPAPSGPRLLQRLQRGGWDAVWWPAFTLGPAPDGGLARATLARLAEFDLAIFVSPAAVQAVADLRDEPWPPGTAIGAVGAATAAAARRLTSTDGTTLIAPPGDDAGSEAFWDEWTRRGLNASRVLILRAQHGREWLGERFAAAGAAVDVVPVYTRIESGLDDDARSRLRGWVGADTRVLAVFSSREAVEALDRQLAVEPGAPAWMRRGVAVATHERVARQLWASGYTQVELTAPDDGVLMARLESLQP
jgi:uroporphyrinogen-III synthase